MEQIAKDQKTRVIESIQIRKQLESIGAMTIDENREKIKQAMNLFVCDAVPSEVYLQIQDNVRAKVQLSMKRKSGIVLEK